MEARKKPPQSKGYDFSKSLQDVKKFRFGPGNSDSLSVDFSLANLFQKLTVETRGILVHPQWKHFRHMEMVKKDQIRLSNGIWRSWHIQFQKNRKPRFCQFANIDPELVLPSHKQPMGVVIEGKYWKRTPVAVAHEYHKWRVYYKEKHSWDKLRRLPCRASLIQLNALSVDSVQQVQVDPTDSSRSGAVFHSLEKYPESMFVMPHPADERSYMRPLLDTADVMQPSLNMLNPTLDEFLDSLDSMEMFFPPFSATRPATNMLFPSPSVPPTSSHQQQQQQQFPLPLDAPLPSTPSTVPGPFSDGTASYLTSPGTKPMSIPPRSQQQQQLAGLDSGMAADYSTLAGSTYSISPSAFLSTSQDPTKERDTIAMELGTPPTMGGNFPLKAEMQMVMDQSACGSQALPRPHQTPNQYLPTQQQTQPYPPNPRTPLYVSKSSPAILSPVPPDDTLISQLLAGTAPSPQQQPQPLDQTPPPSVPPVHHYNVSPVMQSGSQSAFKYPTPSGQHPAPSPGQQSYGGGVVGKGADEYAYSSGMSVPSPVLPEPHSVRRTSLEYHKQSSQEELRQLRRHSFELQQQQQQQRQKVHTQQRQTQADMYQQPKSTRAVDYAQGSMSYLAEQMKNLEHQQLRQLREIEKQQNYATQQYLELLQQYISQTSQEQQQVLQSALSDPNSVEILKTILLQAQTGSSSEGGMAGAPSEHSHVSNASSLPSSNGPLRKVLKVEDKVDAQPGSQPAAGHLPSDLAKSAGVSDFQSRIVMAAAAQASNSSSFSLPLSEPSSLLSTPSKSFTSDSSTPGATSSSPWMLLPSTSDSECGPTSALLSKFKNSRNLTQSEKKIYQELRRQSHISAEQKRRGNIKQGFDHLQQLVINPSQFPSGKVSKATVLEKTIEHIHSIHSERDAREQQMENMRIEIQELNKAITHCQQQLPASGAPITRQRFEENRQWFRDYVQTRTQQNYKFWIFSIILQQLFDSYNGTVSTGSLDEMCQSVLTWFEQNCTLPSLRPVVMNSLRELSMKTSILSDPSKVPQQLSQYCSDAQSRT